MDDWQGDILSEYERLCLLPHGDDDGDDDDGKNDHVLRYLHRHGLVLELLLPLPAERSFQFRTSKRRI
jgi:hypothetical protein